jgi:cell division protease FtsH
LQQVTAIARNMVARWGMSERVGLVSFSDRPSPFGAGGDMGQRDYSDATAAAIDDETHELVASAYKQVRAMLTEHRATLERIAMELRRHETLDAKQLAQILVETGVSLAEVAPTSGAETLPEAPNTAALGSPMSGIGMTGQDGGTPDGANLPQN